MEKVDKNQRACKLPEADLFLKWGNKKRLRCVRVRERDPEVPPYGGSGGGRIRRKISSRFLTFSDKDAPFFYPSNRLTRNSEAAMLRSENRKFRAASPEKVAGDNGGEENRGGTVWPKIYITLSTKEKEDDFMAMKGCKLPHRPKKRAKIIQRTLLLLSPGAWLTDMCQERYEVREKKTTKKRPRGLKGMGSLESDSE